jgi:hypothetical protein
MKAACELTEEEKPKPLLSADETKYNAMLESICQISKDIPAPTAKKAASIITGTGLLGTMDSQYLLSRAQVITLRTSQNQALIIPVPDIPRFKLPEPFNGQHGHSWALIHGTSAFGAQCILLQGFIRPADWTFNENPLSM